MPESNEKKFNLQYSAMDDTCRNSRETDTLFQYLSWELKPSVNISSELKTNKCPQSSSTGYSNSIRQNNLQNKALSQSVHSCSFQTLWEAGIASLSPAFQASSNFHGLPSGFFFFSWYILNNTTSKQTDYTLFCVLIARGKGPF